MALHDHTYAVIMAGGVGSRFWPMSRSGSPKQFLDILDRGRTLIQMTADRLEPTLPYDRMYVVTNVRYKDEVMAQLPDCRKITFCASPLCAIPRHVLLMPTIESQKMTPMPRSLWLQRTTSLKTRRASGMCWT